MTDLTHEQLETLGSDICRSVLDVTGIMGVKMSDIQLSMSLISAIFGAMTLAEKQGLVEVHAYLKVLLHAFTTLSNKPEKLIKAAHELAYEQRSSDNGPLP